MIRYFPFHQDRRRKTKNNIIQIIKRSLKHKIINAE